MKAHLIPRAPEFPYNPDNYFRILVPNGRLGTGNAIVGPQDGLPYMSSDRPSFENWQFLPQEGVWFIRNYDTNSTLQLGVNAGQLGLQQASGSLSQQWNISDWGDGTWRFVNMLVGNGSQLALSDAEDHAILTTDPNRFAKWNVTINTDATTQEVSPDMLTPVAGFIKASPSPSSMAVSSSSPTGQPSSQMSNSPSDGSGLSSGAIAGIVVGTVVGILAIVCGLFLLWRRKRRAEDKLPKTHEGSPNYTPKDGTAYSKMEGAPGQVYRAELSGSVYLKTSRAELA